MGLKFKFVVNEIYGDWAYCPYDIFYDDLLFGFAPQAKPTDTNIELD